MADPVTGLAAVAAASSIIQVIHFSASCIAEITILWASDELGLKENIALEQWVDQQHTFADSLITSHHDPSRPPSAEQINVENIAKQLREEAEILLDLLRSVKVQEGLVGLERKWRVCVQTIKAFKKRKTIEAHQKRLQEIHGWLTNVLLQIIRKEPTEWSKELNLTLMPALERLLQAVEQIEVKTARSVVESQRTLLQAAKDHASRLEHRIDEGFADLQRREETRAEEELIATKTSGIINSLRNPDMIVRRDAIERAHADTFGWIFEEESSPFRTWLASGSGIFWINGHAGSGKSTLMKYISSAAETTQILNQWSEPHSVFIIDTYLWISGTAPQRTEQGLLQAILHQVLRACTDLISIASPLRWDKVDSYQQQDPWSRDELWEALLTALDHSASTSYFCLFVDGLDEYEGDKTKLLEVLQRLAQFPRLKICVSSRPWNVFRNAFGGLDSALCLQDLTQNDIRSFVFDELGVAIRSEPHHEELVEAIVSKAQGVFLWVFLVVRSLRAGCEEGDDMRLLRDRVTAFPPRLEDYFKFIFKQLDPTYKAHTAQALTIAMALHSRGLRMDFSYFWLLFQGLELPDFAFRREIITLTDDELYKMVNDTQKLLNTCCRDFLHMPDFGQDAIAHGYLVYFLHRTVFDFFDNPEMRQLLHANVPDHFKSPLFPCHLAVARAKLVPIEHTHDEVIWSVFSKALDFPGNRCNATMASLEAVARLHLDLRTESLASCGDNVRLMLPNFLAFGLHAYFVQVITKWPRMDFNGWRTHRCAEAALGLSDIRRFPIIEVDMDVVLTMFERGLDAMDLWPDFIDKLVAEYRSDSPTRSVLLDKASQVVKLLLRNKMDTIECAICEEGLDDQSNEHFDFRRYGPDDEYTSEACKRNIVRERIPDALDPVEQAHFWDRCVIGGKEARERRLGILIDEVN